MSNPASLEASPGFFEQLAEKAESHGAGGQNDVNLENSGASVVVEDIHEWPKVNPQHVYNQIRAVTDADKGNNKNVFYTSYGKRMFFILLLNDRGAGDNDEDKSRATGDRRRKITEFLQLQGRRRPLHSKNGRC